MVVVIILAISLQVFSASVYCFHGIIYLTWYLTTIISISGFKHLCNYRLAEFRLYLCEKRIEFIYAHQTYQNKIKLYYIYRYFTYILFCTCFTRERMVTVDQVKVVLTNKRKRLNSGKHKLPFSPPNYG